VGATGTAATSGAYVIKATYAVTSSALDASGNTTGNSVVYLNTAAVAADGLDYASGSSTAAFSTGADDKYGMTISNTGWGVAAVAVDALLSN